MARIMELPVLDTFFMFELKTGVIVMGIMNSIMTLMLAIILFNFEDIKEYDLKRDGDDSASISSVVYTIVALQVCLLSVKVLMDLLLAYAASKDKVGIAKKYCIFWIVFLVLYIISFLKTLFHMECIAILCQVVILAENIYYIIVIRSYVISVNEDGML